MLVVGMAMLTVCCPAWAGNGTIGWLVGHQPVGQPVPKTLLQGQSSKVKFVYERLITFDAAAGMKVVVSLRQGAHPFGVAHLPTPQGAASSTWICYSAWAPLSSGTSCQLTARLFSAGRPLMWGLGGVEGDFSIHGLATDAVSRITVTLTSGRTIDVPLLDNAFLFRLPAHESPSMITAYNTSGKVVERKRA